MIVSYASWEFEVLMEGMVAYILEVADHLVEIGSSIALLRVIS